MFNQSLINQSLINQSLINLSLINKTFHFVDEFCHIKSINKTLLSNSFLVLKDSNGDYKGILSSVDLLKKPHFIAIDCVSNRPKIDVEDNIEEVLNSINDSEYNELPVFEKNIFLGVVCKKDIVYYLKSIITLNNQLAEKEINQNRLNLVRDRLLLIISHDLKSPFHNIIAFTELLDESNNDLTALEAKEYLSYIRSSSKSALAIVDGLIDWGKSHSNHVFYKPHFFSITTLIEEVIESFYPLAKVKNISLDYLALNLFEFNTDREMLKTILRNLISNAIKFTNTGGQIQIKVVLKLEYLQITVADNGVGLNVENSKDIFSKFNSSFGTYNEKGLGIGLFLCQEIVEKLGGKIWVTSKEHKGSNFKLRLPLNEL
jgi:signal transduction histidine kinase